MSLSVRLQRWSGDPDPVSVAMTDAFSDYAIAIRETPEDVLRQVRTGLCEPERSFVAWAADRPVAALLGRFRTDGRARVQAMGVAPDHRRHGVGRDLLRAFLAEADAEGIGAVHLECLQENARAQTLYTSEGFVVARPLHAFRAALTTSIPSDDVTVGGREILPPDDDRPARPLHRDRLAVERMPDVEVRVHAAGAWIVRAGELLLDVGGREDVLTADVVRALLQTLPAGGYRLIDVPGDDPLVDVLQQLRWVEYARQYEMVRGEWISTCRC